LLNQNKWAFSIVKRSNVKLIHLGDTYW